MSIIPMRAEPSERAEMVSQLLFGDAYTVEERRGDWQRIRTCDCGYEGWITSKLHHKLTDSEAAAYLAAPKFVVKDFLMEVRTDSGVTFPIFIGSSFPIPEDGVLRMGSAMFRIDWPEKQKTETNPAEALLDFARKYLHAPYLWGGRTPAGIDCSGFTQIIYKSIGIALPRDASQQVMCGETVDFVEETQPGDLAFFQNEEGKIVHVGMVCGHNQIIHSSGWVRIDTLDSNGIFRGDTNEYSHTLRIIKRILK